MSLAAPSRLPRDRKSTRLNSSHVRISYAVFCLKKKNIMEGAEFTEKIINGVERPVKSVELFAFTLRVRAGNTDVLTDSVFFFNDTATTEIYTLSLHDALPI